MALKRNPPLKRQLLNLLLPSMLILVTTLGLLLFSLTSRFTNQQMLSNATQLARSFAQQSVLALLTNNAENAEPVLQQMQAFPDLVGAGLWSSENKLLVWRGDASLAKEFQAFLAQDSSDDTRIWQTDQYLYVAASANVKGEASYSEIELAGDSTSSQTLGYALLLFSKARIQQQDQQIVLVSLGVVAIAAIIIFVFLSNWVQKITSPLRQLSERMLGEDFLQQASSPISGGSSEIQNIGQAYQQMAAAIKERDEALRLHQQKLESLVDIRTRELVVARDAALTASRHKSEFLANITHELRTPLQSIIGYIDLVTEELEFTEYNNLTDDLNRGQRNAQNLLKMINSLLDLAKIEAGKMELHSSMVRVSRVVELCVELITPLLQQNQLQVDLPDQSFEIWTDGEKLLQILVNLMSNACKFTHGGKITLQVQHNEHTCVFWITDTGIGIEPEHLQRIFTPFYQVDGSNRRSSGGTGLGLAITKQFVDLMAGTIEVFSEAQQGSVFVVSVPINMPSI
jgi:signal transduction histidine kinase